MADSLDPMDEAQSILDTMTTDEFKNDLMGLIKSRFPLVYLTTNEERRMLHFFRYYCRVNKYQGYVWDSFRGLVSLDTGEAESSSDELKNPPIMLEHILNKAHEIKRPAVLKRLKEQEGISGIIFLLLDFHRYLDNATVIIERRVKEIAHMDSIITTIMTGPYYVSTAATDNLFSLLDFPYPNSTEIKESLWTVVRTVSKKLPKLKAETQKMEENLVKSVQGLTIIEAQSAYAKSLVIHKKWDMSTILNEKKQIIKKSGLLEFHDPTVTIDDVGGLGNLVTWLKRRKHCFSQEAADYGLAIPKGVLCIGVPGCGKSLICKAVANLWGMPLLRLDFGRLFGSLVGQSEESARAVIKLAETVSPCITGDTEVKIHGKRAPIELWFDDFYTNFIGATDEYFTNKECLVEIPNNSVLFMDGFNPDTGEKEILKMTGIIRRPAKDKKLLRITTDDGHSIKVTHDHKILVENDGEKCWKKAKELIEGDSIITCEHQNYTRSNTCQQKRVSNAEKNFQSEVNENIQQNSVV